MADVVTLSRLVGTEPMTILSWPMQDFLMLCESLNIMAQQEEREKVAPASALGMIPGIGVIH